MFAHPAFTRHRCSMKSSLAVSPIQAKAREEAYRQPIETLNPAQPELFQQDAMWPLFERLRKEDPVHFTRESDYGPVLVDHQVQRHHGRGHEPPGLLVRTRDHDR